ncbi:response regulator transcription factor [Azotobacter salinestris]|uniref:response regulator transcription factor n=1 Tax=Azotobacter salinestris TaxID=69964 RepID=UPI001FCAE92C|nr:LuxR C-terminal-related transcriptional regulator [Azotobacter salinestris]
MAPLSLRESQVARLIATGYTNKQAARHLGLSDLTVRKHRENLYRKLGVGDVVAVALYCLHQGLTIP